MSQHHAHHHRDDEPELASETGTPSRREKDDELDAIIEDIDSVLEDAAIAIEYVQKGGQ